MIVFYHKNYKVTQIVSTETGDFSVGSNGNIVAEMLELAVKFDNEILVWCEEDKREELNIAAVTKLFHHRKMLFTYNPASESYFGRMLGYIEDSPFIKVNKEVRYPTWQMSSAIGAVHASVIQACRTDLKVEGNFDYFLNSFARRAMSHGLFCYSEPKLLLSNRRSGNDRKANLRELFVFTKQHYRTRWILLLFFNLLVFERKLALLPMVVSFFYAKRKFNPAQLNKIPLDSNKNPVESGTIDVLIPTIGRKEYLLGVLNNLAAQTHLPKNIIIIEQNPDANSSSDLDFIHSHEWPFAIKHHFTHQTGACNARNIGLEMIESECTFFADDDIVIESDLLEKAMETFRSTGNEVFLVACLLQSQQLIQQPPKQFAVFGAGHAFVKSDCFKGMKFNMAYEFGFGEDNDFGMQLRNRGYDVLYISTSKILHLKAPIGGFRTKPVLRWQQDEIQPKPSPTVMLFRLLYDTSEQLSNYKTTLFFKNLNKEFFMNPFKYLKAFRQKWNRSIYWATKLKKQGS
ncbi:glycosyltransferase family 2 protein [Flavobacterium sp.]